MYLKFLQPSNIFWVKAYILQRLRSAFDIFEFLNILFAFCTLFISQFDTSGSILCAFANILVVYFTFFTFQPDTSILAGVLAL